MAANHGIPQSSSPLRQDLNQLKQICQKHDDGDESISYQEEYSNILQKAYAQGLDQEDELIEDFGYIHTSLGSMCYKDNNYDQALTHYNAACNYYYKINNKPALALAIQGLADSHYMLDQHVKVLEYYPIVLKYYKEVGEISKAADSAYYSAESCLQLDKYEEASDYANEAQQLYESINDDANQAYSYKQLGRIRFCEDKFSKAAEYYNKAVNIRERLGLTEFLAMDYVSLGDSYYWMDKNKKAKDAYVKAKDYNNQSYNNDTQKTILLNLAKVCYYLDLEEDAIVYGKKAVELYNSEENQHDLIEVYTIVGNSYYSLEKYSKAITCYLEAELRCGIYYEDQDNIDKKAELNVYMYNCCYQMGQNERGMNFLKEAIEINEKNKNIVELAENFYKMALTLNGGLNDQESAYLYCQKALNVLHESDKDEPALKGEICELLGDIAPQLLLQTNKEYLRKTKGYGEQYTEAIKTKMKEQTLEYYNSAISCFARSGDPDSEEIVLKKIKLVKKELQ